MVTVHKKEPINTEGDILVAPCGQESEEEADYVELLPSRETQEVSRVRTVNWDDEAPPLPPKSPRSPKVKEETLPPPLPARNYQGTRLR